MNDLTLIDASFASRIVDRHPSRVSKSVSIDSLTDSTLWVWIHVSCTDECEEQLAAKKSVKIFLDWYLEEDGVLRKQRSVPLTIKDTTWRTWGGKGVTPGAWVVVVRAEDSQWVCLKDQCDFGIEVKKGKKRGR